MVEAFIGLGGVIIGALVATGTAAVLERRREKRAATIASRLVASELDRARKAIAVRLDFGRWWLDDQSHFSSDLTAPLAASLSSQEWESISYATGRVRYAEGQRAAATAVDDELTDHLRGSLGKTVEAIDDALSALKASGHD